MPDNVEALLREVLAGQAGAEQRMNDLSSQLRTTQEDARQARDLGNRITTILEEQNILARFSEHRTEIRQVVTEIRQDFVAANTTLRKEVTAIEKRVDVLEADKQQREGIKTFVGWLMKNCPWLLAGIAAFAAGLGFKDSAP